MTEKSVITKVMAMAQSLNLAVVNVEDATLVNLNDVTVGNLEQYVGELRLQGKDGLVGNIELRAQNPFDHTQFEKTLDVTVSEKESKSYLNVAFNKIETLSDCEAYFTGLKFTFAPLAAV